MAENYPTAERPEDPSSYFLNSQDDLQRDIQKQKFAQSLNVVKYYAVKIWPYVQRIIQTVLYFLINLIKTTVKIAIDEIKNFKG